MKHFRKTILTELREIVFGLEDGMVSTLGAVTGLAGATNNQPMVIISGFVIIAVESLSMAAGTYLSNKSEDLADKLTHNSTHKKQNPIKDGLYMGASYIIGGLIPLYPYWFFPVMLAIPLSMISVVIALFVLGYTSGKMTKINPLKNGLEMTTVSVGAAALGFTVGKIVSSFFPDLIVK